jgi:cytochrome P450
MTMRAILPFCVRDYDARWMVSTPGRPIGEAGTIPPPNIGAVAPKGGLLGLLPELARDPLAFMATCTQDYGDFVRVRLGLTPSIVIGHPDLVEEVLVTRNHDFRKGQATRRLGSLLGKGLLLSEGDFWLRQRRLMQPAFHRQRLAAMAQTMVATTAQVLDTWQPGEVRSLNQEMTEVTLRIVGRTLFGSDVSEDLARIRRSSALMNDHFRSRLFTLLTLLPDSFPTRGNVRYQRAVRDLHQLVHRILGERRLSDPGDDLLGMLLSAKDETGRGMSDRQLRDEVMTLLLAGHDTTALTLTWGFTLLARHPLVERRLHDEIGAALGDRPPSPADAPRLTYAEHVVTETLRLYPTAWAIGREALRDTHVGGQHVARGTTVLISPWVLHRDIRFWDEPEAFRPERWSDGLANQLPRFAYVPFGAGQRVCIGASFAQLEALLLLTTIAQRFKLELVNPSQPVEPWPVVTLRTRGDVHMQLKRRRTV